jgi:hypothetical protein
MDIAPRLPCDSIGFTSLQQMEAVLRVIDHVFRLALYEYAGVFVFSDVERLAVVSVLKQIVKFLIIDLQEGAVHCIRLVRVCHLDLLQSLEQCLDGSWDDTIFLLVTEKWISCTLLHFVSIEQWTESILIARVVVPMRTKHGESLA